MEKGARLQHNKSDNALAVVKAAINLVPVVGGALASLIGDYVPTSTQKSINRTMDILGEKLNSLEGRIDVDIVDKDDFSELFKSCYLIIIRSQREEKLRAAANFIANLLLKTDDPAKSSYTELDHLVRCLDTLSIGAIGVLGACLRVGSTAPMSKRETFQFEQLRTEFEDLEPSLVMSLLSELRSMNLVAIQEPGIRTADYGNYLIELTPIGRRFIERFIQGRF